MRRHRNLAGLVAALLVVAVGAAGCGGTKGKLEDQKFVSVQVAMKWITDNECDRSGAQKGDIGYNMGSGGGIGHINFMCDNGKTFSIDLYKDDFYRAKRITK